MLDLSASSCFKKGTFALVSLPAIRTDTNALFYRVTTFYAQRKLFIVQFLVTMVEITNLIRIDEISADNWQNLE
jgi:hypothetical protein